MKTKFAAIFIMVIGFTHYVMGQTDWKPVLGDQSLSSEPQYFSRTETTLGVNLEYIDKGARITFVNPNTPAEESGFKTGDIITSIGAVGIHSEGDYRKAMDMYKPDETVAIAFIRKDAAKHRKVSLGKITVYKKAGE